MTEFPHVAGGPAEPPRKDDGELDSLRDRLIRARAERGLCPPMEELQKDDLAVEEPRPGSRERAAHVERCEVCQANLVEWRGTWESKAAGLVAWARHGGKRLGEATGKLAHKSVTGAAKRPRPGAREDLPTRVPERTGPPAYLPPTARAAEPAPPEIEKPSLLPKSEPDPPRHRGSIIPLPRRAMPTAPSVPDAPAPIAPAAPSYGTPRVRPAPLPTPVPMPPAPIPMPRAPRASRPTRERMSAEPLPPLIVLESTLAGIVPAALLAAASERGAAVVTVDSVEEALRDPDFGSVRALVLTRSRPLAEWGAVLESVRRRAPGRIVLGVVPSPRLGPASITWQKDPCVLIPPVGDADWAAALARLGWAIAA